MPAEIVAEPGSFRDKNNRVFYRDNRIYRFLTASALEDWKALTATGFYPALVKDHKLIGTRLAEAPLSPATDTAVWSAVVEHDRVPFISYPYEWPFGMLKDAALLQLELIRLALSEGLTMKDATPFNIQWFGSQPVFIDLPSFTRWNPGEPWVGYRQFCELFLYPLFIQAYRDIPFSPWLRGSLEGIAVESCRGFWSLRDLLRPGILKHVFLHAQFQQGFSETKRVVKADLQRAGFNKELILANIGSMEKLVRSLKWTRPRSEWSDYATARSYSP